MAEDSGTSPQSADGASLGVERVARLLLCSPRRVQQLVKEGWIERPARGEYNLIGAVHGRIRQLEDAIRRRETKRGREVDDERTRLMRVQREAHELRNAQLRGELVSATEVGRIGTEVGAVLKARVMQIRTLGPLVRAAGSDAEAAKIIEDGAREALEEVARLGTLAVELARRQRSRDGGPGGDLDRPDASDKPDD